MTNKKVNPADILISPFGMENFLVINQANDEVIKNNELLLDKPYFSLEEVLDGLNKDGHYDKNGRCLPMPKQGIENIKVLDILTNKEG